MTKTIIEAAHWIVAARKNPSTEQRTSPAARIAFVLTRGLPEMAIIRRNARRDFIADHTRAPTDAELEDAILGRIGVQHRPAPSPPLRPTKLGTKAKLRG